MKIVCVFDEHSLGQTEQAELFNCSLSEFLAEEVYGNRRVRNYSHVYELGLDKKLYYIGEIEYIWDRHNEPGKVRFLPVNSTNYYLVDGDCSGKKSVAKYNEDGKELLWEDKT